MSGLVCVGLWGKQGRDIDHIGWGKRGGISLKLEVVDVKYADVWGRHEQGKAGERREDAKENGSKKWTFYANLLGFLQGSE